MVSKKIFLILIILIGLIYSQNSFGAISGGGGGDWVGPIPTIQIAYPVNDDSILSNTQTIIVTGTSTDAAYVSLSINGNNIIVCQEPPTGVCNGWSSQVTLSLGENTIRASARQQGTGEVITVSTSTIKIYYNACFARSSCLLTESPIFSLYQSGDSHVRNDVSGTQKVCCPRYFENDKTQSTYNFQFTGTYGTASCGTANVNDEIVKAFNTGTNPLDAHVIKKELDENNLEPPTGGVVYDTGLTGAAGGGGEGPPPAAKYDKYICLAFNSNAQGNIQCTTRASACNAGELNVISLEREQDSHVGAYSDYQNRVCCKVTSCPVGFIWDDIDKVCEPSFPVCFKRNIATNTVDTSYACDARWTSATPGTQASNEYWNDALTPTTTDCFADETTQAPIADNGRACCFETTFAGQEYGSYWTTSKPSIAIRKTTVL